MVHSGMSPIINDLTTPGSMNALVVPPPIENTWTRISKIVRGLDEAKVKDYKEDIDTILVFVRTTPGLSSVSRRSSCSTTGRSIFGRFDRVPRRVVSDSATGSYGHSRLSPSTNCSADKLVRYHQHLPEFNNTPAEY